MSSLSDNLIQEIIGWYKHNHSSQDHFFPLISTHLFFVICLAVRIVSAKTGKPPSSALPAPAPAPAPVSPVNKPCII